SSDVCSSDLNVTYTITTSNNGPSDAQAVSTTDTIPANTTLVSFTQTSGPANGGTLPTGGTETFVLIVHLNANAPSGSTITNTANVSSTTPDSNLANNTSSVNSTVAASADVQVVKTGPATVTAGSNVTYTIPPSTNAPPFPYTTPSRSTIPANTTLVSFTQTSGPANGGTLPT